MQTVTQIQQQIQDQLTKIKETYNTFLVTDNYDPYKVQKELHNLYLLCNKQELYLTNIIFKDVKQDDDWLKECDEGNGVRNPLNPYYTKRGI